MTKSSDSLPSSSLLKIPKPLDKSHPQYIPFDPLPSTIPLPTSHFLIVDKPLGVSSTDVVNCVKHDLSWYFQNSLQQRIDSFWQHNSQHMKQHRKHAKRLRELKLGHAGTLDPFATGVLVIGLEHATKKLTSILEGGKEYIAEGYFGKATDTQDLTGTIVEECEFEHLTKEIMENVMKECFTGEILQKPPMYSAVRVNGKRLYDIARAGEEVEEIKERTRTVYEFEIVQFNLPCVTFRVKCQGGLYVRTLIHDLAKKLNSAAHLTALRRTQCAQFGLENAVQPQDMMNRRADIFASKLIPLLEE
eukprot:CAMPEP_0182447136 /NCGR_PEP_ID=MMETSP1172-20130603/11904_1 /TAXON_ID=708627 /ORGANISM="Timspurckia oligopyrenoides, Strain CCMP3278" /LENGTH=303 /DNA_ID=CAMNT_0024643451 /DNA_START=188 /DNA_END=1099 /DNA_ORIENTATION=-